MTLTSTVKLASRLYNKYIMASILIIILILLSVYHFNASSMDLALRFFIYFIWIIFVLLALLYALNGILIYNGIMDEVYQYQKIGKPMEGVRGYTELISNIKHSKNISILIAIASVFSLILFAVSISNHNLDTIIVSSLALTVVLISISIIFLIKFPELTALEVGGLISFYSPDTFPMVIDNLLADVVFTYADPITFMAMDNWSNGLNNLLSDNFSPDTDQVTRLERAREKIFLIAYLSNSIPETMTEEVIYSEIAELVGIEHLDIFVIGMHTGLSWDDIKEIIKNVEKQSPEVFRLVDRLLIHLMENYNEFISRQLYFTVITKPDHSTINQSAGLLAFFLNNTDQSDRRMNVEFRSDIDYIQPYYQKIAIILDPMDTGYPENQPELIADGDDVLSLLSKLLQVGDAVWFRFKAKKFGMKIITVQAEEESTDHSMGQSIEVKYNRGKDWLVNIFVPKLTAIGGVVIPILTSILFL